MSFLLRAPTATIGGSTCSFCGPLPNPAGLLARFYPSQMWGPKNRPTPPSKNKIINDSIYGPPCSVYGDDAFSPAGIDRAHKTPLRMAIIWPLRSAHKKDSGVTHVSFWVSKGVGFHLTSFRAKLALHAYVSISTCILGLLAPYTSCPYMPECLCRLLTKAVRCRIGSEQVTCKS